MKKYLLFLLLFACNKPTEDQPEILTLKFSDIETSKQVGFSATIVPTFTARLSNPVIVGNTYTVDVEFMSTVDGAEIFASNFRFWYDAKDFSSVVKFKNFQGGYNTYLPTDASGITPVFTLPKSYANWFNLEGDASFANGSFGLRSQTTPIPLSVKCWTKLFEIELVKTGTDLTPEIILDLELNPALGGFLHGNSGFVASYVTGINLSQPANEEVLQYNWRYTGLTAPYGTPK